MDIKGPVRFHKESSSLEFDHFCGAYKGDLFEIFSEWEFEKRPEAYLTELRLDT